MFVVRGQYPSGDVVEEFLTREDAEVAVQRHQAHGVPVAIQSPAPPGTRVPTRCSFCGKDRGAAGGLVAGPPEASVAICDRCEALCGDILRGRR